MKSLVEVEIARINLKLREYAENGNREVQEMIEELEKQQKKFQLKTVAGRLIEEDEQSNEVQSTLQSNASGSAMNEEGSKVSEASESCQQVRTLAIVLRRFLLFRSPRRLIHPSLISRRGCQELRIASLGEDEREPERNVTRS